MEPKADDIDKKYYYKIGEAARKIGVEPYVIRYWETEFSFLKPYKSKSSHRLYSKADVEKLLLIKDYLYNKRFTIEGAKKAIKSKPQENVSRNIAEIKNISADSVEFLNDLKEKLNSVKSLLSSRKSKN